MGEAKPKSISKLKNKKRIDSLTLAILNITLNISYLILKNFSEGDWYEKHRSSFADLRGIVEWYNDRIHGEIRIRPNRAFIHKLRPESLLGLLFRGLEDEAKKYQDSTYIPHHQKIYILVITLK